MTSACTAQIRKFLADRFVLGTAQLGMPYGIANQTGKPDFQEVISIIRTAAESGIDCFDTATAYGDCEEVLGNAVVKLDLAARVQMMSKFGKEAFASPAACVAVAEQSLGRLRVSKLASIFAHSVQSIDDPATVQCFAALKSAGLAESSGVSVYTADEALAALQKSEVDVVQMPLNVFDHQPLQQGVIERARQTGKRLIFRSVFLQGLLVMPLEQVPERMSFAREFLEAWHVLCERFAVPPRVMALQCALSMSGDMPLLIGCESAKQLQENIDALDYRASHVDEVISETSKLAARIPEKLRNPALWPTNT